ncbi:MAG: hypothetical protein ACYDDZ_05605 [Acidimicrobiales bacterium]
MRHGEPAIHSSGSRPTGGRLVLAVVLGMVALLAAACSSSATPKPASHNKTAGRTGGLRPGSVTTTVPRTTTTSTTPTVPPPPVTAVPVTPNSGGPTVPVGSYANGSTSVPHYVLAVTTSTSSQFDGSVSFVYQDGRRSEVFSFTATPTTSAFPLRASNPTVHATADISGSTVTLPGCQAYLTYSGGNCTFTSG